jgi:hypothetical protein
VGMAREAFMIPRYGKSNVHLLKSLEASILAIWVYIGTVLVLYDKVSFIVVGEKWGNVRICP